MRQDRFRQRAAVSVVFGVSLGTLSACLSASTRQSAGAPVVPRQYAPVADANWSPNQPLVGRAIPCQDGKILIFTCHNTELVAFLPVDSIGKGGVRAIWGWIDSTTGREFLLVGNTFGTSFVEITDPLNPRYLGILPIYGVDIKVYKNYAFLVSEDLDNQSAMAVFDLTQLRTAGPKPVAFQAAAYYGEIQTAHTIAVNEATGFAYLNLSDLEGGTGNTCGGGPHMVDIRDPLHPVFAGCYTEPRTGHGTGGVHDNQCVLYQGPDGRYRGRELCFNAAQSAVSIADVTEKAQPKTIGIATYPNAVYAHQGWLSDDQRYFFINDELDRAPQTRTIVFDLMKLDDPVVAAEFFGSSPVAPHNLYVRGPHMYQSLYNYDSPQGDTSYPGGVSVRDVRDPKHMKEIGYFLLPHTTSWTNYPFFTKHGDLVAFTGGRLGLFLIRYRGTAAP